MRRVLLCILDGWGERTLDDVNGLSNAKNWHRLQETYPHTFLQASESFVGLPAGQMGNSEVGHMTIGLGRVIMQDLPRINKAIETDTLQTSDAFKSFVEKTKKASNCCHVMGLLSPGGVHSHEDHFFFIAQALANEGINVIVHPILDGRDTPPCSAEKSLEKLEALLNDKIKSGTLSGRFYAMDRDERWNRTEKTYNTLMRATGVRYQTFLDALSAAYSVGSTDEFVEPSPINNFSGIGVEDSFFFVNFRGDRSRQLISSLLLPDFNAFNVQKPAFSSALTMAEYSNELSRYHDTLFSKTPVCDGLSETISKHSLCQLHIAETEKYAHVTYFFNGNIEKQFDGERRVLVPSPSVTTYDLKPEMSAREVTDYVLNGMEDKQNHFIVVNYANPDMVGHTGIPKAIEKAISTIDSILVELENKAFEDDWLFIITADHGNVEQMIDSNGQPHTAHTCNPVPFVVINGGKNLSLKEKGTLADVAPTILHWMSLPIPEVMSGCVLQQL
ncbi:MAG: 2,3-bisphosphoglycerate-independent phosphoglycerate mutase [Candidatus Paracaedibacteraceae bacterium]|nr:2,3-bisphosphoglycerate-independent phosphoglycerate mutase [Candidatus Paracaedibacteraceae bacterium]